MLTNYPWLTNHRTRGYTAVPASVPSIPLSISCRVTYHPALPRSTPLCVALVAASASASVARPGPPPPPPPPSPPPLARDHSVPAMTAARYHLLVPLLGAVLVLLGGPAPASASLHLPSRDLWRKSSVWRLVQTQHEYPQHRNEFTTLGKPLEGSKRRRKAKNPHKVGREETALVRGIVNRSEVTRDRVIW